MSTNIKSDKWATRASLSYEGLMKWYWNSDLGMFNNHYPNPDNKSNLIFHYWWYAHSIDSLVDAYNRTNNSKIPSIIQTKYEGLVFRNGGQPTNLLYDDMEWLALALLRTYEATNRVEYVNDIKALWNDIKTGWNDIMGGGIAWHKERLHFKNTPANGPAIILAVRLYRTFGNEEHLDWAYKIFDWLDQTLVERDTGFVNDGINGRNDEKLDPSEYTYNQGLYIGACVELFKVSGDKKYIEKAKLTAQTVLSTLTDEQYGVLKDEGMGDGGLFKGITVRYLTELILIAPRETKEVRLQLEKNAEILWKHGRNETKNIFNSYWGQTPSLVEGVSLSAQLSGVMLMESMATLERNDN